MVNTGDKYVTRNYRSCHAAKDLRYFNVIVKETDLAIGVDKESYTDSLLSVCKHQVIKLRGDLETYITLQPEFRASFFPVKLLPGAPLIAKVMAEAAEKTGVGPMAAVAGAIAQAVGEKLIGKVQEIIVENGGDIYINSSCPRIISVFAGESRFSNRIGIRLGENEGPSGVCTSSGTVGPSISLGKADAVLIKADSAALADAAASRAANQVQTETDLMKAIESVQNIKGIRGVLAIKGDKMAAWGDIELVPVEVKI
ncbi:MAG TPA: UPF0280 family protein [Syntrophomonadaceae bacterium]|nr:UPF0280 family protein [Syntrophomonadaceae bacterium]